MDKIAKIASNLKELLIQGGSKSPTLLLVLVFCQNYPYRETCAIGDNGLIKALFISFLDEETLCDFYFCWLFMFVKTILVGQTVDIVSKLDYIDQLEVCT